MKLALIDNEVKSLTVLRKFIEMTGEKVNLVGEAKSVQSGIEMINKLKPEAILLDVEMDDGSGFDLLSQLREVKPHVVFVTAHNRYAAKAFRENAVDYLEKPVVLEHLTEALLKLKAHIKSRQNPKYPMVEQSILKSMKNRLALPTRYGTSYIEANDIIYIKADGAYSEIYLENETNSHLVSRRIMQLQDALENLGFVRIHRSYMVNLSKVKELNKADGGYVILENGFRIPFSKHYKSDAFQTINTLTTGI